MDNLVWKEKVLNSKVGSKTKENDNKRERRGFYIYIYIYNIILEVGKKLHFHPDKPVSWSLTLQGILIQYLSP